MINTEELKHACLGAIRSLELSYPSFKPDEDVIEFWSSTLIDLNLSPEDIKGGVKMLVATEINNFNVNLPTLISYCKRVRGKRLKQLGKSERALVATTEEDVFNREGESEFSKASREAQRELHDSYKPNAKKIYMDKITALHKKHGKPVPEWD